MGIDTEEVLLDLVKGQGITQQMVSDMSGRLFGTAGQPGVLQSMHLDHKATTDKLDKRADKLDERVGSVEKKVWYSTGFGAALGAIAGFLGFRIIK